MNLTQRVFLTFIAMTALVCLASPCLLDPSTPHLSLIRLFSVLSALICLLILFYRPLPSWNRYSKPVTAMSIVGIGVHCVILLLCTAVSL